MIIEAILKINPSAVVSVSGTDIDNCVIEWLEETTPISKADIKTKINETKYQRDREKEYPSIVDQLDDIYHNGIDGWKATIKVTKDKYPKE
jgi:hypothetical protein